MTAAIDFGGVSGTYTLGVCVGPKQCHCSNTVDLVYHAVTITSLSCISQESPLSLSGLTHSNYISGCRKDQTLTISGTNFGDTIGDITVKAFAGCQGPGFEVVPQELVDGHSLTISLAGTLFEAPLSLGGGSTPSEVSFLSSQGRYCLQVVRRQVGETPVDSAWFSLRRRPVVEAITHACTNGCADVVNSDCEITVKGRHFASTSSLLSVYFDDVLSSASACYTDPAADGVPCCSTTSVNPVVESGTQGQVLFELRCKIKIPTFSSTSHRNSRVHVAVHLGSDYEWMVASLDNQHSVIKLQPVPVVTALTGCSNSGAEADDVKRTHSCDLSSNDLQLLSIGVDTTLVDTAAATGLVSSMFTIRFVNHLNPNNIINCINIAVSAPGVFTCQTEIPLRTKEDLSQFNSFYAQVNACGRLSDSSSDRVALIVRSAPTVHGVKGCILDQNDADNDPQATELCYGSNPAEYPRLTIYGTNFISSESAQALNQDVIFVSTDANSSGGKVKPTCMIQASTADTIECLLQLRSFSQTCTTCSDCTSGPTLPLQNCMCVDCTDGRYNVVVQTKDPLHSPLHLQAPENSKVYVDAPAKPTLLEIFELGTSCSNALLEEGSPDKKKLVCPATATGTIVLQIDLAGFHTSSTLSLPSDNTIFLSKSDSDMIACRDLLIGTFPADGKPMRITCKVDLNMEPGSYDVQGFSGCQSGAGLTFILEAPLEGPVLQTIEVVGEPSCANADKSHVIKCGDSRTLLIGGKNFVPSSGENGVVVTLIPAPVSMVETQNANAQCVDPTATETTITCELQCPQLVDPERPEYYRVMVQNKGANAESSAGPLHVICRDKPQITEVSGCAFQGDGGLSLSGCHAPRIAAPQTFFPAEVWHRITIRGFGFPVSKQLLQISSSTSGSGDQLPFCKDFIVSKEGDGFRIICDPVTNVIEEQIESVDWKEFPTRCEDCSPCNDCLVPGKYPLVVRVNQDVTNLLSSAEPAKFGFEARPHFINIASIEDIYGLQGCLLATSSRSVLEATACRSGASSTEALTLKVAAAGFYMNPQSEAESFGDSFFLEGPDGHSSTLTVVSKDKDTIDPGSHNQIITLQVNLVEQGTYTIKGCVGPCVNQYCTEESLSLSKEAPITISMIDGCGSVRPTSVYDGTSDGRYLAGCTTGEILTIHGTNFGSDADQLSVRTYKDCDPSAASEQMSKSLVSGHLEVKLADVDDFDLTSTGVYCVQVERLQVGSSALQSAWFTSRDPPVVSSISVETCTAACSPSTLVSGCTVTIQGTGFGDLSTGVGALMYDMEVQNTTCSSSMDAPGEVPCCSGWSAEGGQASGSYQCTVQVPVFSQNTLKEFDVGTRINLFGAALGWKLDSVESEFKIQVVPKPEVISITSTSAGCSSLDSYGKQLYGCTDDKPELKIAVTGLLSETDSLERRFDLIWKKKLTSASAFGCRQTSWDGSTVTCEPQDPLPPPDSSLFGSFIPQVSVCGRTSSDTGVVFINRKLPEVARVSGCEEDHEGYTTDCYGWPKITITGKNFHSTAEMNKIYFMADVSESQPLVLPQCQNIIKDPSEDILVCEMGTRNLVPTDQCVTCSQCGDDQCDCSTCGHGKYFVGVSIIHQETPNFALESTANTNAYVMIPDAPKIIGIQGDPNQCVSDPIQSTDLYPTGVTCAFDGSPSNTITIYGYGFYDPGSRPGWPDMNRNLVQLTSSDLSHSLMCWSVQSVQGISRPQDVQTALSCQFDPVEMLQDTAYTVSVQVGCQNSDQKHIVVRKPKLPVVTKVNIFSMSPLSKCLSIYVCHPISTLRSPGVTRTMTVMRWPTPQNAGCILRMMCSPLKEST